MHIQTVSYIHISSVYFTLGLGKALKGFEHLSVLQQLKSALVWHMVIEAILNCADLNEMLWT